MKHKINTLTAKFSFLILIGLNVIGLLLINIQAATFSYPPLSISNGGVIPDGGPAPNGCAGNNGVTVTFDVTDDFNIDNVSNGVTLGVNVTHTWRGDLVMDLSSPITANSSVFIGNGGDGSQNFNVMFDELLGAAIAGNHLTTPDFVNISNPQPAGSLTVFNGQNAMGLWTFFVCDQFAADTGALTAAQLNFVGTLNNPLTISKATPTNNDADGNGYVSAGDTLTYTITATNVGVAALTNVVVTDSLLTPSSNTCATVAAAGTCVLTGTYLVQTVDELIGTITNSATANSNETNLVNSNTVTTIAGANIPSQPEDVFYMPLPEADALTALLSIFPGENVNTGIETCPSNANNPIPTPTSPISTYSSITVLRSNTIIYYDEQEDGYEANTINPVQPSTQVWGDRNIANGFAPGSVCLIDACDVLNAGIIIVLDNQVNIPDNIVNFDGGDKISATDTISMTKANWASGSRTLLAGSFELYPTTEWGTNYNIPVGEDVSPANFLNAKYQYVGITVMAQQDGTNVSIDLDGNPLTLGDITNVTLNEGQSQFIDGGILIGATVTSNFNVQVDIVTGDICDTYESRFFTLFPTRLWDNSYYNPVGTSVDDQGDPATTRVLLYNPGMNDITILIQDGTGIATQIVTAGNLVDYPQNNTTAAHYCTTTDGTTCDINGDVFYAMASIDADPDTQSNAGILKANRNDWGFTLVPKSSLSQQALVGLGFGKDPLDATGSIENSSPVWITADMVNGATPVGGIQICADYDNDGTDVGPPQIDPVTGQQYDITFSVNLYDSVQIRDTDRDQTSLLVWICDTDITDANNAILAVAWGQDPLSASGGTPAIDLGTGVPNVASLILLKEGQLSNDVNGDGFPSIGDTITYLITLSNVGFVPVDGEVLTDALPPNVTYIANSTIFDNNSGSGFVSLADNANPTTPFPLDEGGVALPGLVQVGKSFLISFDVTVTSLPLDDVELCNSTSVNIPIEVVSDEHCLDLLARTAALGNFVWDDINQNGIQDMGEVGIEGVTVTLLDNMGVPVVNGIGGSYTTTTAADGSWSLTKLPAGDYQILFDTSTATNNLIYSGTSQNQGVDDTIDSDGAPNGTTGQIQTSTFTLATGVTDNTVDAGFYQVYSVIGNRVWLDLDNDGVQDANEDGIANITVQLTPPVGVDIGAGVGVAITTVTDTDGNYIFSGLPVVSGYQVTVTNPPVGLNRSYDEDGTGTAHTSTVNLTMGDQEYLTADFGYAPSPGTIGDYVWSDANGNGQQDPGEIGLGGVTVYLCTVANVSLAMPCSSTTAMVVTTTTDATGKYLYTGLDITETYVVAIDSAALIVAGYTQTGDPDSTTVFDDETTVPALNSSNDVNLDADFGYQPPNTVNFSDIGDTIYQDNNGNGVLDVGEPGIEGITVQLFVDTNADNIPDTPIASVTTDASGLYLFPSLPNGLAYSVLITDAFNVLNGFNQTGDPDAMLDNQSTLVNLSANNLMQDFGYRPIRSGAGLIGDFVFLDVNGNGMQDLVEQGLEGVTVRLFNAAGDFIGITSTDENGKYLFTGLDTSLIYTAIVDTSTLPNGGVGWTNNVDPDGGVASQATTDLSLIGTGVDLSLDFGYTGAASNTISGTVWTDNDGNGLLTDGTLGTPNEVPNGIINVTIELTDSNGNIVGTTTTDANGDYSFIGLPDGSYTVKVTDKFNELANLLHTDGPTPGADNNSQNDFGYVAVVSGGSSNTTADFGYQPVVTTPITLAGFRAVYNKVTDMTTISWSTMTESGNIGFELFYEDNGFWDKATPEIIPSKSVYSTGITEYEFVYQGYAKQWAIVDIDIFGQRKSHGIYNLNRQYGNDSLLKSKSIQWEGINEGHQLKAEKRRQERVKDINSYLQSMKSKQVKTNGEGS